MVDVYTSSERGITDIYKISDDNLEASSCPNGITLFFYFLKREVNK